MPLDSNWAVLRFRSPADDSNRDIEIRDWILYIECGRVVLRLQSVEGRRRRSREVRGLSWEHRRRCRNEREEQITKWGSNCQLSLFSPEAKVVRGMFTLRTIAYSSTLDRASSQERQDLISSLADEVRKI